MMISKKVSSFSPFFIRKSSASTSFSSATAAVAEVKKKGAGSSEWKSKLELKDDRSLYLCFKGIDKGIVIRSIKLSHLLSSSWWWPTETEGWWLKDTHIFCESGPSFSGSGGKEFQPKRRRDNCKFPSALIKRMKEAPQMIPS
ncbi:hypothetical protein M0R45_000301 [Rubus argutus]|uniref:Uncharacterized protein n=1 Tax=Rubus argutus TaxID=59490 RepID=A0AAW1VPR8_RUBAR